MHGYRQNAAIFRQKSAALRKALKNRVEFGLSIFKSQFFNIKYFYNNQKFSTISLGLPQIRQNILHIFLTMRSFFLSDYISAPLVPSLNFDDEKQPENGEEQSRAWWFSRAENTFSSREETEIAEGFEESSRLVREYLGEKVNLLIEIQKDLKNKQKYIITKFLSHQNYLLIKLKFVNNKRRPSPLCRFPPAA